MQRSFRLYLRRLWFARDECSTTENVAGAIVRELPGQRKTGVLGQLRLLPPMLAINGRLLPRILRALPAAGPDHPVEPHYYLPVVGAEPQWQGRGLGTALMRPVLERCDDEKPPAYLEATSPRNRAVRAPWIPGHRAVRGRPWVAARMADVADSRQVSLSARKPPVAAA